MINIKKLTEKDIGRRVRCNMYKGIGDFGRIQSWNDKFIYIIYDGWGCGNEISEPVFPKYLTLLC